MQVQRAMRLAPVQENRHCSDGDMGDGQRVGKDLPARGVGEAVQQEVQPEVRLIFSPKGETKPRPEFLLGEGIRSQTPELYVFLAGIGLLREKLSQVNHPKKAYES
jgi:hypothetical protein